MLMMNSRKMIERLAGLGILVTLFTGCQQNHEPKPQAKLNHVEEFAPDDDTRQTRRIFDAQIAAGVRADATFYASHFDGPALTSLGTTKLDYILHDSHSCNPLVIYMDVPADGFAMDRRTSISNYLVDRGGLKPEQVKFEDGPNPQTNTSANQSLKDLDAINTLGAPAGVGAPAPAGH